MYICNKVMYFKSYLSFSLLICLKNTLFFMLLIKTDCYKLLNKLFYLHLPRRKKRGLAFRGYLVGFPSSTVCGCGFYFIFQLSHWSNIINCTARLVEIKAAELNQVIKTYEKVWFATKYLLFGRVVIYTLHDKQAFLQIKKSIKLNKSIKCYLITVLKSTIKIKYVPSSNSTLTLLPCMYICNKRVKIKMSHGGLWPNWELINTDALCTIKNSHVTTINKFVTYRKHGLTLDYTPVAHDEFPWLQMSKIIIKIDKCTSKSSFITARTLPATTTDTKGLDYYLRRASFIACLSLFKDHLQNHLPLPLDISTHLQIPSLTSESTVREFKLVLKDHRRAITSASE
ncbi:hypothetical protein VP01_2844g1 [Puccinia sorghi]|uniref:Uncharacterized protein n=1 Tax=Puccinia sorghi TaxID=27349 RepID=A0A0L6V3V5_9BASI|nr:hypothetical protein VP01_2844g1 [Puccinia sorghi]